MEPINKDFFSKLLSSLPKSKVIFLASILLVILTSATAGLAVHIGNEGSEIKKNTIETHKELEMFEAEQQRINNITREQYQRIEDKLDRLIGYNLKK